MTRVTEYKATGQILYKMAPSQRNDSARANSDHNRVLAFDIETTGLNAGCDLITVAATYDGENATAYRFVELDQNGVLQYKSDAHEKIRQFCTALDKAPYLAAFNGVRFDLPFIVRAFGLSHERGAQWVLKCLDVFEVCKAVRSRTFGLNMLLALNGFEAKTGSGANAVVQARSGLFEELEAYCIDDAKLTHVVSMLPAIALPEDFTWRRYHPNWLCDVEETLHLLVQRDPETGAFAPFSFETKALAEPTRAVVRAVN